MPRRLSEMTIGDIGKGLARYRPIAVAVGAILLVVTVLPGKPGPHHDDNGSTDVAAGVPGAAGAGPEGGAAGGPAGTSGPSATATAGAGTTRAGAGAAAGVRAGTSGATATAAGSTGPGGAASTDPNCDPATGRIRIPSVYAPPCVPAFDGNNGGPSYQGVSGDTITIVHYEPQVDAATQAVLTAAGVNDSTADVEKTYEDYTTMLSHHFQLYGRHIKLIHLAGSGKNTDDTAGKADAQKVALEYKAFLSWGSANDAYVNELVAHKVLCVCTTTVPKDYYLSRAPYVWGNGLPDENQAYLIRAEVIGKQIANQKAKWAGDPVLQTKDRTYGLIWYNTGDDSYAPGEKFFEEELAKYGVHLTDQASYIFDAATGQDTARTIVSKFKSEGITDIIFVGDFIYPVFYTQAATNQQYFPEWIITGSALTDTTLFARVYDKQQWNHAFGVSLLTARTHKEFGDAYRLYDWQFHAGPPAKATFGPIFATIWQTFVGLQGAGERLTPQTYRDGLFRYPPSPAKGGITNALVSWGRTVWPWDDYNVSDDATLIWWDNQASGPDEQGNQGVGMYQYIDMGKRYLPGQVPKQPFKAFDTANATPFYDQLPAQDKYPEYPEHDYY